MVNTPDYSYILTFVTILLKIILPLQPMLKSKIVVFTVIICSLLYSGFALAQKPSLTTKEIVFKMIISRLIYINDDFSGIFFI